MKITIEDTIEDNQPVAKERLPEDKFLDWFVNLPALRRIRERNRKNEITRKAQLGQTQSAV